MEYVLKTNNLSKHYKKTSALDGITMNVAKGCIYGFIGKNGSGKTTLIRVICGLQPPTSGDYQIYGIDHANNDITKARRRMGAVVEVPAIYMDMDAKDNLIHQYKLLGLPSMDGLTDILALVNLDKTGSKKAKNFSLGMRQRLGIAIALVGDPDFLVLDEPVNGLDPQGIIDTRELILKLNRERQITVLISSHMLDELSKFATHYGFIDKGKIIKEISASELRDSCRKSYRIEVTTTDSLVPILDEMGVEYRIISQKLADIYAQVSISKLALALSQQNCEVISISEHNQSLESYYVNLVGGNNND